MPRLHRRPDRIISIFIKNGKVKAKIPKYLINIGRNRENKGFGLHFYWLNNSQD